MAEGIHTSWLVQILPYIDERNTYKHIDLKVGVYDPKNATVRALHIAMFNCPSYAGKQNPETPLSNYAGCHNDVETPIDENNNGVLFLNSHITAKDVTDGLTNTIFVGEKSGSEKDLGWMSGTRATLRNTGTALSRTINDDRHGYFGPKVAKASDKETQAQTPSETPDESMPADESTTPAETTPDNRFHTSRGNGKTGGNTGCDR